jgi:hypothetical protein
MSEIGSMSGASIGYCGPDIPVELILAADALPVRLRGIPDMPTPNADRYLERSFDAEVRSIAEQWITGKLDHLRAVIFSRAADSTQRLYYYLCELQRAGAARGPKPLLYDVAKIPRATSQHYSNEAVRRLAAELAVDEARLPQAAQRVARRARLIAQLQARRESATPVAGSHAYRLLRAAEVSWTVAADQALQAELPILQPRHRLLFAGSTAPDDRFHVAVENAGSNIVAELDDSIEGPRAFLSSAQTLMAEVQRARADGVLIWLLEEEEARVWNLPEQLRALAKAAVPALVLTRQSWSADAHVLERIAHFASSLVPTL